MRALARAEQVLTPAQATALQRQCGETFQQRPGSAGVGRRRGGCDSLVAQWIELEEHRGASHRRTRR